MIASWEAAGAVMVILTALASGVVWMSYMISMRVAANLEDRLIERINGTYIRRGECGLIRSEMERRLDKLEEQAE